MGNIKNINQKIDYFKLPFEVHYSDAVPVTQFEFKSDLDQRTGRFSDVKTVHIDHGSSYGLIFVCKQNRGPELFCCIFNSHDEVSPDWLSVIDEKGMHFNYSYDYLVSVEDEEIKFLKSFDECAQDETLDFDYMESCCSEALMVYHIVETIPDFLILDSNNSRLKVNLDGYILDEKNNITNERIFDPSTIDYEKYEDYTTMELWEAKSSWVKSVLETDFPNDINLVLSFDN